MCGAIDIKEIGFLKFTEDILHYVSFVYRYNFCVGDIKGPNSVMKYIQ